MQRLVLALIATLAFTGCAAQDDPPPATARAAESDDVGPIAFGLDVEGAVAQWEHCSCNLKAGRCALALDEAPARTLDARETDDASECRAHCVTTGRDAGVRCGRPVKT